MEIKITLDKKLLNNTDSDFFHYECGYELAECEYGTWRINSLGELSCRYIDEENDIDTDNLDDIMRYYVRNNEELEKAVDDERLIFDMNNWLSIEFFDNNDNFIENSYFADSVYGSISEGYNDFIYQIENNKDMIMKYLKESGVTNE